MDVAARLADVRRRVAAAVARRGPGPKVRVVAVVKRQPLARIQAVLAAGVDALGENYAQDLARHRVALGPKFPGLAWHFIGRLQRNKVKIVVGCALIHAADRLSLLSALETRAARLGIVQDVLVEVNVAGEPTKAGVEPADLASFLEVFADTPHLRCRGFMCLPPPGPPEASREWFRMLRSLRDRFRRGPPKAAPIPNVDLTELSMGTSGDFEVAIEEGATMVRLGTVLLGPRASPP